MKVTIDEKKKIAIIEVEYDAQGRTGNGAKWTKVHATDTAQVDHDGKTKRVQVSIFGK